MLSQICIGQVMTDSITNKAVAINLQWKLEKGDTIAYKTLMENSKTEIESTTTFQKILNDSKFANQLKEQMENTNLVTYLTNSNNFEDVIEIEMIGEEIDKRKSKKRDRDKFMNSMLRGTLLRGSVYKSGEIHSFWLKKAQFNLIAMLFELPTKTISEGETWEHKNIMFISNDQNFICEEAKKTNQVKLQEIKYLDSDTIAVLEYDIREYVKGEFGMNNQFSDFTAGKNDEADEFFNELTKQRTVIVDYAYRATAEFSLREGKWVSFKGIISSSSIGLMGNSSTVQNIALEEIK